MSSWPPPPVAHPAGVSRPRWGVPDALLAWVAWFVANLVAGAIALVAAGYRGEGDPTDEQTVAATIAIVFIANGVLLGAVWLVGRIKGARAGFGDFGLALQLRDAYWLLVGAAFSIAATWTLLYPIQVLRGEDEAAQDVVRQFEATAGAQRWLFALGVAIVAPLAEELLFRGLLLRALARRYDVVVGVGASGLVFGLLHLLGGADAYVALAPITALGVLSGVLAVRSGTLSRSIFLHAGFNLLTVIVIVS